MIFHYTIRNQHQMVLDAWATGQWNAGVQDEIKAAALKRADGIGHECQVLASDESTVLYQTRPTPPPVATEAPTLLEGLGGWLKRNVQDPGEDDEG